MNSNFSGNRLLFSAIRKYQTRFDGFDEKIISMYARGMTVRDIQAYLRKIYGVEISESLISRVTDAVINDVKEARVVPYIELHCTRLQLGSNPTSLRFGDNFQWLCHWMVQLTNSNAFHFWNWVLLPLHRASLHSSSAWLIKNCYS